VTFRDAETVTVLLVEDDEDDYIITRDMLERQDRARFVLEWCSDYSMAAAAIARRCHDVYLIDYRLGERTGLDLVRDCFASRSAAPAVIILTGHGDYQIDLESTALGVTDFLVKQELNPSLLERSIRYALSHQKALRDLARSEERYELAASAVNDGIWDWDLETGEVYFSARWHEVLGQPQTDGDERPEVWFDLVHEEDLPSLRAAIDAHLGGATRYLLSEHRIRHTDGTWRWVLTRGLAKRGTDGKATRMAGSLSDITERLHAESRLLHMAFHDPLTDLPNRALLLDRTEHALRRSVRELTVGCAVLFLDIDRFKLVNDSFSHTVGDRLLVMLAKRLTDVLRPGDTVARIGGDEFAILLDDVALPHLTKHAAMVAERIRGSLTKPFCVDDHQLSVTASIGIALGRPEMSAADLLRNADIAMYDAKRRKLGTCALFDESMHRRVVDSLLLENDLRRAVERSLVRVHYQPVIDLATGYLAGFEALARWPFGWSAISPEEFIPVAEETGMIRSLGIQVLRSALATLASWRRSELVSDRVRMSINVSARQLDDPRFPEDVLGAIDAAGLPRDLVHLEITESALMREPERMERIVSEVCATGIGLELDDFGTGYSSLSALHQFPVAALKIDRSFVASLTSATDGDAIVRSTIALAHSLGLAVISEGIEEPGQLRRLRVLGCQYGQGFLFSEPLSSEDVEVWLSTWSPGQVVAEGVPLVSVQSGGDGQSISLRPSGIGR
jgi:diguanylate cyclase (GGDEF)-like protein/PAS domain S-box-containing protein